MNYLLRIRNMTKTFPDGAGTVTVFEGATQLEMRAASQVGDCTESDAQASSTLLRIAARDRTARRGDGAL